MSEQPLGSTYTRTTKLGSGAMGTVWRGHDKDGTAYAFKVLRTEYAEDPGLVQRFVQERSVLTQVDDPHVVRMHDLVVEGTTLAIVMDLVEGGDLRGLLSTRGPLPPGNVCRLGAQIASGLAAVHRAGLVHRDIKPENVLLDTADREPVARVSDFGIARLADASAATRSSMMLGTPNYVSPEIAEGHAATPAADVYSLGIVLYELCCGVTPFEGGGHLAVIRRHGDSAAPQPPGVPEQLWDALRDMMAKEPGDRPTVGQVQQHLGALALDLRDEPAASKLTEPLPLAPITATQPVPPDKDVPTGPENPKQRPRGVLVAGILVAAIVLAGGGYAVTQGLTGEDPGDGSGSAEAGSAPTPAETTDPTSDDDSPSPSATSKAAGAAAAPEATADDVAPTTTEPVQMPDVVGMSLATARSELRGTQVSVIEDFDEQATDNEVLIQDVAPGEVVPDRVELTVARQPVTVYLDDLETTTGGFETATGQLGGEFYPRSLMTSFYGSDSTEWNLGKGYRQLKATVGRSDEAESADEEVQVEVFLDQRKVWSERVVLGDPVEMDVDVTDALRLRIDSTALNDGAEELVLGDIRLIGLPGEVPEPPEE